MPRTMNRATSITVDTSDLATIARMCLLDRLCSRPGRRVRRLTGGRAVAPNDVYVKVDVYHNRLTIVLGDIHGGDDYARGTGDTLLAAIEATQQQIDSED